jgi:uncharacterized protein (DUF2141 family)
MNEIGQRHRLTVILNYPFREEAMKTSALVLSALAMLAVVVPVHRAVADPPRPSTVKAQVSGIKNTKGKLGCALYASAKGFPDDPSQARVEWLPIKYNTHTCEFSGVQAGFYAIAVMHDENENGKMDRNFLGKPTEAFGASNNVRHAFSAPTFDEAKIEVKAGMIVTTRITLVY